MGGGLDPVPLASYATDNNIRNENANNKFTECTSSSAPERLQSHSLRTCPSVLP